MATIANTYLQEVADTTANPFIISNSDVMIMGSSKADNIVINSGVTGTIVSNTVEGITLSDSLADYTFLKGQGSTIQVFNGDDLVFSQRGVDGTTLTIDGKALELSYTYNVDTNEESMLLGDTAITNEGVTLIDEAAIAAAEEAADVAAYDEALTAYTTATTAAETAAADVSTVELANASKTAAEAAVTAATTLATAAEATDADESEVTTAATTEAAGLLTAATDAVTAAEAAAAVGAPITVVDGETLTASDDVAEIFTVATAGAFTAIIEGFDPENDTITFTDKDASTVAVNPLDGGFDGEVGLSTTATDGTSTVEITLTGMTSTEEIGILQDVSSIIA